MPPRVDFDDVLFVDNSRVLFVPESSSVVDLSR